MLYYKNASGGILGDYALNFNGSTQYLLNDVSTPFAQWERTQAWTFYANVTNYNVGTLFSNVPETDTIIIKGIVIGIDPASPNILRVFLRNNATLNGIFFSVTMPVNFTGSIQITYDGSSLASGVSAYLNNVLQAKTVSQNNLTNTIINTRNGVNIGKLVNSATWYLNTVLRSISFVDYVQNATELSNDFTNGFQSTLSGNFLFNLPLIYKKPNFNNLDSTVPILELTQNLDMNFINYPNPLILNTNLIKI